MRWSLEELRYAWKIYSPLNFRQIFTEAFNRIIKRTKLVLTWIFTGHTSQSTFSLDDYFATVIVNKLTLFKKHNTYSHPLEFNSIEEWHHTIDVITTHFKMYLENNGYDITKGLELFTKYFRDLWD